MRGAKSTARAHGFAIAFTIAFALSMTVASAHTTTTIDRVAVRYVTPETGGSAKPRFFTEREVALFARIEAHLEQAGEDTDVYAERYVRTAIDRLVARSMLSSLLAQRGIDPPDVGKWIEEARTELAVRLGGPSALETILKREGIEEIELTAFLREQVRAAYYVDRAMSPIFSVSEDALREAHRASLHPFRNSKFDDVRAPLRRWLVTERFRAAELEFVQSARDRIRVISLALPSVEGSS